MTTMLFYDQVTPLNRDRHRTLRLKPMAGQAGFAATTHYVPLASSEFYQAARDYPVIFAGSQGKLTPVVLLGLRPSENLFLQANGEWAKGTYVPAFVRRYPFILAKAEDESEYTVCIDDGFDGFSQDEGTLLFDSDGKDTAYLSKTVEFLNQFNAEMSHTQAFVERLQALELLVQRNLRVSDSQGRHFVLQDFHVVDEDKLAALDDLTAGELNRNGYLGWVHAHLVSLGNAARLPTRLANSNTAEPPQAEVHLEEDQHTPNSSTADQAG